MTKVTTLSGSKTAAQSENTRVLCHVLILVVLLSGGVMKKPNFKPTDSPKIPQIPTVWC